MEKKNPSSSFTSAFLLLGEKNLKIIKKHMENLENYIYNVGSTLNNIGGKKYARFTLDTWSWIKEKERKEVCK